MRDGLISARRIGCCGASSVTAGWRLRCWLSTSAQWRCCSALR